MKTVMKHSVIFLNDDERNHNMLVEFNLIIQHATISGNVRSFDNKLNNTKRFRYFNIYINREEIHVFQRDLKYDEEVSIDDTQLIIHIK